MASHRVAALGAALAAALSLGLAFAVPAVALPGDDPVCPEHPGKTCTQTPPALDSLVQARAKAEVLTPDELLKLCADVRVRQLVKVRVAVGNDYQLVTLDGKTCEKAEPTPVVVVPAIPAPTAPTPVIVATHLPVTH